MTTAKRAAIAIGLVVLLYVAVSALVWSPFGSTVSVTEAVAALAIGLGIAFLAAPVIRGRSTTPTTLAIAAMLVLGGIVFGMNAPPLGWVIQPEIQYPTPALTPNE